jgi:hypothetical protein
MIVLDAALRAAPDHFRWRTETYEFVDTPIAIDLLNGSAELREGLENGVAPRALLAGWTGELADWKATRAAALLYPR